MSTFKKAVITLLLPILLLSGTYLLGHWSVTALNIVSGIVVLTLGTGIAVAAAMANDSGRGGFFIYTFQFMGMTYLLVYLIGLTSSIWMLYSDHEDKRDIATLLASMSMILLTMIVVLFLAGSASEIISRIGRDKRREKEIADQRKPYLVHLPHCGTTIQEEYQGDYLLSKEELDSNIIEYADLYTDELFEPLLGRFGGVKNEYSRLFFDPERYFDDEQEVMSQKGLGWFYEKAILEDKPLRHTDSKDRVADYYHRHYSELNRMTQQKLDLYGKCTIIDCHSFSNQRYWFQDPDVELPDICIGYDEEHVNMELVELLKEAFSDYSVEINSPYSGSMVPSAFYEKSTDVKSVMIEINKRLYLDSENNKGDGFEKIRWILDNVMTQLIFEENYRVKEWQPFSFE